MRSDVRNTVEDDIRDPGTVVLLSIRAGSLASRRTECDLHVGGLLDLVVLRYVASKKVPRPGNGGSPRFPRF